MSRRNRSSAGAANEDSTVTFTVLTGFFSCLTTFGPVVDEDNGAGVVVPGAGVPERDGSAEPVTCRSLPCVSTSAVGNAVNLTSRAGGRSFLARSKSLLAAGDLSEDNDHSY